MKIKKVKIIKDHSDNVNKLCMLLDGRLASCSDDKTIKIYDMKNNYHCDLTIIGHSDIVMDICQSNGHLISCSGDQSIKIWNIFTNSYNCEYTIEDAHNNGIIRVIPLTNQRLASYSSEKEIKIWNGNYPYIALKVIYDNNYIHSILQLRHKEILLCGSFSILSIWNLSLYQCEARITQVETISSNNLLELPNNKVISAGMYTLTIVNLDKYIIEYFIENDNVNGIYSVSLLSNNNVVCGCYEKAIYVYINQLNSLLFNGDHTDNVITDLLSINEHQFISCSDDNSIQIWEY